MSDHAVDSNRRQRQRQQAEGADQSGGRALLPKSALDLLGHGFYSVERKVLIQRGHLAANRWNKPDRIAAGARHKRCSSVVDLQFRKVNEQRYVREQRAMLGISCYSDYLNRGPRLMPERHRQKFTDCALSGPKPIRQSFV